MCWFNVVAHIYFCLHSGVSEVANEGFFDAAGCECANKTHGQKIANT